MGPTLMRPDVALTWLRVHKRQVTTVAAAAATVVLDGAALHLWACRQRKVSRATLSGLFQL